MDLLVSQYAPRPIIRHNTDVRFTSNSQVQMCIVVMFIRRINIKILILLLPLLLCSCQLVEFQDYVHKPTQKLRQSLIYSGHKNVRGIDAQQLVLVPNFRTFTKSFPSNRAELFIVTSLDQEIIISEAVLRNLDTGAYKMIALDSKDVNFKPVEGTGYFIKSLLLLDKNDFPIHEFNTAKKLELVITYSVNNDAKRKEAMIIKLVTKKDFAWVT